MADYYTPERDRLGLRVPGPMREDLPKAFLIGDSISIGYTEPVTELLAQVCNVRRAPDNCGDTRRGLRDLDAWLGDVAWDIIHFNWGLHDLCYRHPDAKEYGNRDKANGKISVPIHEYEENLEQLVTRLKARCPRLIWASTTFVPEGESGRFRGDEERYNAAAAQIMNRHGIEINDLHALTASFDPSLFTRPGDVHYTPRGSKQIARQVAAQLQQAAEARHAKK